MPTARASAKMAYFGILYGTDYQGTFMAGRRSGMTTQAAVQALLALVKPVEPEVERVVFWKRVLDPLV